jgi:alkylated DNA nucleotide flippase Atl1
MNTLPGNVDPQRGKIGHLFQKVRHGRPTIPVPSSSLLICETGLGLSGDVHANRLSPRQILITLESELDDLGIPPGTLRENMVIALDRPEFFKPGSAIVTSGGVEIGLTMYCEPCKRILPVVKNLRDMLNRRGILGYIVRGGNLAVGDAFEIVARKYEPLPESVFQKFLDFVPLIPSGRVVRYIDVTIALGVADSFVRAVPGYIKRSLSYGIPVHRIVTGNGSLLDFLPAQAEVLEREGVTVQGQGDLFKTEPGKVELSSFLWQG